MQHYKILKSPLDYIGSSDLFLFNENYYLVISYSVIRRKYDPPFSETLIYKSDEYGNRTNPIPLKVHTKRMETVKAFEAFIKEINV